MAAPPAPPPDPNAGVAAMLATPDQQLHRYVKGHAAFAALKMLGATLSDIGSGINGQPATAAAGAMNDLYAHAAQPLQLAQQKARMAGLMQAYAGAGPELRSLILTDPEKAMATIAQNQQLQTVGLNGQLQNSSGAILPPVPNVTPFGVEGGGVVNKANGDFQGISQAVTTGPGQTATSFTPSTGPGGGPAPGLPAPSPAAGTATPSARLSAMLGPNGQLDPTAFYKNFILPHEGGLNPSDMNGSPTNYGFNQKSNMDINVRNLTPDSATARFATKYWPQTGSANIANPALAAINADTAFINPSKAQQFLQQSGGDPARYMAARQAWMAQMVAKDPRAAKYARAWSNRNADLESLAGIGGAPQQAQPSQASPAAPAQGQGGFGAPIIQGKTNTDLSPQEAQSLNLAPGHWQRSPTGELVQASKPPDGDLARIDSLTATTSGLQALYQEQQSFLAHNGKFSTGPAFSNPEVHGVGINPIAGYNEATNPDFQAMEGSSGKQLFLVKPANAGARILQSEIPYWAVQTQSPSKTGEVNGQILKDTASKLAQARQQSEFYRDWVYNRGSLQGADKAWSDVQRQQRPGGPAPANAAVQAGTMPSRPLSPQEAAKLPSGTPFITTDGRHLVRQ